MKRYLINAAVAAAVAGAIILGLAALEASTPGFEAGAAGKILPLVIGLSLFQGLNTLSGNRKASVADAGARAEALRFAPERGRGWLVVIRTSRVNPLVGYDVEVDGAIAAQLRPRQFAIVAVPTGRHTVFADIPSASGAPGVKPTEVEVLEGQVLAFKMRMTMGLMRNSLALDPVADTPALRAELGRLGMVAAAPQAALSAQQA